MSKFTATRTGLIAGILGLLLIIFGSVWITVVFSSFEKIPSDWDQIDDLQGTFTFVHATLRNDERYQILLARDGEEALDIARLEKPDLVFMDIMMPKMDGYSVCRELKDDPDTSQIKVVLLTALDTEFSRDRGMEAGAVDYITKPFSPIALLEKVDDILGIEPI